MNLLPAVVCLLSITLSLAFTAPGSHGVVGMKQAPVPHSKRVPRIVRCPKVCKLEKDGRTIETNPCLKFKCTYIGQATVNGAILKISGCLRNKAKTPLPYHTYLCMSRGACHKQAGRLQHSHPCRYGTTCNYNPMTMKVGGKQLSAKFCQPALTRTMQDGRQLNRKRKPKVIVSVIKVQPVSKSWLSKLFG